MNLQGSPLQGWSAPNITNDSRTGLGGWSAEDIAAYLKPGHTRITAATGPMAEAVELSTSMMTDDDIKAIATYLKSLPGGEPSHIPLAANAPEMTAGGAIYRDQCSACHGFDGKGIDRLFPSVANSSMARADDQTSVIRIVLRGARSVSTAAEPTAPGMPSYGWQLNDSEVAAVLTFIRNSWGGASPAVSSDQVARLRATLAKRSD